MLGTRTRETVSTISDINQSATDFVTCDLCFSRGFVFIVSGIEIGKSFLVCLTDFLELLYVTSGCGEIDFCYLQCRPKEDWST